MLYLSAIILSFFLTVVLITKRNKTHADYILSAWLGITGFQLLAFYLLFTNQQSDYSDIIVAGFSLPLAQGPFLYLYTRQQTSSVPFDKKQILNFLPVFLSFFLFAKFHFLSLDQKIEVFQQKGEAFKTQSLINLYAIYASGIVYIILSLRRLFIYRKSLVHQFSNTEKINFNWLLYLIIWMVVVWILVLFEHEEKLIYGAAALFVLWLGYFGMKQVQVFSQNTSGPRMGSSLTVNRNYEESNLNNAEKVNRIDLTALNDNSDSSKYQKSTLSEQDASLIHERLMQLMAEQKPYKNPDLTLNELAAILEVHPNHLSQVINSREKKSFYDLINEMRVGEFIKLISQRSSLQFTLLAISYDCGFNSKASFNRNFKKYTGLTPRDWLKQQPAA
jgi:AraC-like DNA-binding protein